MSKNNFFSVDLLSTLRLLIKVIIVVTFTALLYFGYQFFKEANLCPKGSIWTGQQCSGTGVVPIK